MIFHWSLSDSKCPQVPRILLSILAVLKNIVVWMVSTDSPTSKSSSTFNKIPKAPITIGIIVTFMFHSFFTSLATSRYLFFSYSFSFILWSAGTAKSTILQVLSLKLKKHERTEKKKDIYVHGLFHYYIFDTLKVYLFV